MNARLTIVISLFISIYTKQIKLLENLIFMFFSAFPLIENKNFSPRCELSRNASFSLVHSPLLFFHHAGQREKLLRKKKLLSGEHKKALCVLVSRVSFLPPVKGRKSGSTISFIIEHER
jgi:hypothetical protein